MAASARAAGFGDPDKPPQGAVNAGKPADLTIPGPHSDAISGQFPLSLTPGD